VWNPALESGWALGVENIVLEPWNIRAHDHDQQGNEDTVECYAVTVDAGVFENAHSAGLAEPDVPELAHDERDVPSSICLQGCILYDEWRHLGSKSCGTRSNTQGTLLKGVQKSRNAHRGTCGAPQNSQSKYIQTEQGPSKLWQHSKSSRTAACAAPHIEHKHSSAQLKAFLLHFLHLMHASLICKPNQCLGDAGRHLRLSQNSTNT
jgi:hypothetical protein